MGKSDLFTDDELKQIEEEVSKAEQKTSAELLVLIEDEYEGDTRKLAESEFVRLNVGDTQKKNGVLILIVVSQHKFEILADEGILANVGENVTDKPRNVMQDHFRQGRFLEGLLKAVDQITDELKKYYPIGPDDINELPNLVLT